MSRSSRTVNKFLQHIFKSEDLWRSLDLRVIAVETESGVQNLATRLYLDHRQPDGVPGFQPLPTVEGLFTVHERLPFDTIEELCFGLSDGTLNLEDAAIHYLSIPKRQDDSPEPYRTYRTFESRDQSHRNYSGWSAHVLSGSGPDLPRLLRLGSLNQHDINHRLRTSEHPFDGLEGLVRHFVAARAGGTYDRKAFFDILAPLPIKIDRASTQMEEGQLRAHVTALHERALHQSRLGIFASRPDRTPISRTLSLCDQRSAQEKTQHSASIDIEVPDSHSATLFLSIEDRCVDRKHLRTSHGAENVRANAYETFDPDLETFSEFLHPPGKEYGDHFERSVARLLTFCGFVVDDLSSTQTLSDAVDALAYDASADSLLACEITGWTFDSEKVAKLVARSGSIRDSVTDVAVQPVIICPLSRDKIDQAALNTAAENEVIVLAESELRELENLMLAGIEHSEISETIMSNAPSKERVGAAES